MRTVVERLSNTLYVKVRNGSVPALRDSPRLFCLGELRCSDERLVVRCGDGQKINRAFRWNERTMDALLMVGRILDAVWLSPRVQMHPRVGGRNYGSYLHPRC